MVRAQDEMKVMSIVDMVKRYSAIYAGCERRERNGNVRSDEAGNG